MKKAVIIIVAVVLLGVIGWFIFMRDKSDSKQSSTNTTQSEDSAAAGQSVITYTDEGFNPATLTVAAGTTVTITNESSEELDLSSDKHPVHTDNPELNQNTLTPGDSETFKVTKTGTWGYHNHLNPDKKGKIVVQ